MVRACGVWASDRIYEERCYDTKPLTPVKDMAAAAAKAGRPLTVVDVGGNIGVFARYAAEQVHSCATRMGAWDCSSVDEGGA